MQDGPLLAAIASATFGCILQSTLALLWQFLWAPGAGVAAQAILVPVPVVAQALAIIATVSIVAYTQLAVGPYLGRMSFRLRGGASQACTAARGSRPGEGEAPSFPSEQGLLVSPRFTSSGHLHLHVPSMPQLRHGQWPGMHALDCSAPLAAAVGACATPPRWKGEENRRRSLDQYMVASVRRGDHQPAGPTAGPAGGAVAPATRNLALTRSHSAHSLSAHPSGTCTPTGTRPASSATLVLPPGLPGSFPAPARAGAAAAPASPLLLPGACSALQSCISNADSCILQDSSVLHARILQDEPGWGSGAAGAKKPSYSELPSNGGRVQVLAVDDEPVNLQVLRALLWGPQYDVVGARWYARVPPAVWRVVCRAVWCAGRHCGPVAYTATAPAPAYAAVAHAMP